MSQKKNQLERAAAELLRLKRLFPELDEIRQSLRKVVGEAQSRPPFGEADGTLDETGWKQLADTTKALDTLLLALLFTGGIQKKAEGRGRATPR